MCPGGLFDSLHVQLASLACPDRLTNNERVKLYSELCTLKDGLNYHAHHASDEIINKYMSKLNLRSGKTEFSYMDRFLEISRILGVFLTIVVLACTFVIPCSFFLIGDIFISNCGISYLPNLPMRVNVLIKRFMGAVLLRMAGIFIVLEDYRTTSEQHATTHKYGFSFNSNRNKWKSYTESPGLICFTHASSIDTFVLAVVMLESSYTFVSSTITPRGHHVFMISPSTGQNCSAVLHFI